MAPLPDHRAGYARLWASVASSVTKGCGDRTPKVQGTGLSGRWVVARNGEVHLGRGPFGVGPNRQVPLAGALTPACARTPGIPPRGGEPELGRHAAPGRRDVQGRLLLPQLRRGPAGPQLPQRLPPVRGGASRWRAGLGRRAQGPKGRRQGAWVWPRPPSHPRLCGGNREGRLGRKAWSRRKRGGGGFPGYSSRFLVLGGPGGE